MNWTVRNRLLAGFLVVTALAGLLGSVTVYQMGSIRDLGRGLAENTLKSSRLIGQLDASMSDLRMRYLEHIDTSSASDMTRYEIDLGSLKDSVDKGIQEYASVVSSGEERSLYESFINAYRALVAESESMLTKSRNNEDDVARAAFFGASQEQYDAANRALTALGEYDQREAARAIEDAERTYAQARLFAIVILAFVVATSTALAFWLSSTIASPISRMVEVFRKIASGDTQGAAADLKTMDVTAQSARGKDEIGSLIAAAREMTEGLRATLAKNLREGVDKLSASTAQVGATAKEYTETSSAQAAAVAEVSTTVEEIRQTSEIAAASARDVAGAADEAARNGHVGRERLGEAMAMMKTINERVGGIADQILHLSEKTSQISTIVDVVSDLAEQSNLLAVNASIEAAKAGEQGRGFSVVASEVRSLSEQSKRATQQIRGILSQIQKATQSAVMATEEGTKRSADGRVAVEAVREVVDNLALVLEESSAKARQIAGTTGQQASGISQIAMALSGISKAARDNAMGVRQLDMAVVDLERLTADLKATSDRF